MKHHSHQRILKTVFYDIAFIGLGLASGVLGPSLLRLEIGRASCRERVFLTV